MVKYDLQARQDSYFTNADGDILFEFISKSFEAGEPVTVSFKNITGLNSSFINSAFIQLLEFYSFDYIKNNLKFSDSNKQINQLILSRFKFEVEKKANSHV